MIYHSGVGVLPAGYLGIDTFFVISDFLMGGIILRELDERRFSLMDLYMRRVVRLLAALLNTLLFTTLLASVLLIRMPWQESLQQRIVALTFTANYVLMLQLGYFDTSAKTTPLLHMWSLFLEEQFYLFPPLRPMFSSRRLRMPALALPTLLWFVLCWALIAGVDALPVSHLGQQKIVFYSLPTRAWEMLLSRGSAVAPPDAARPGIDQLDRAGHDCRRGRLPHHGSVCGSDGFGGGSCSGAACANLPTRATLSSARSQYRSVAGMRDHHAGMERSSRMPSRGQSDDCIVGRQLRDALEPGAGGHGR